MEIVRYEPFENKTAFTVPKGGKISGVYEHKSYLTGIKHTCFSFEAAVRSKSDYVACYMISSDERGFRYRVGNQVFNSVTPQDILNIYNAIQEQLIEEALR